MTTIKWEIILTYESNFCLLEKKLILILIYIKEWKPIKFFYIKLTFFQINESLNLIHYCNIKLNTIVASMLHLVRSSQMYVKRFKVWQSLVREPFGDVICERDAILLKKFQRVSFDNNQGKVCTRTSLCSVLANPMISHSRNWILIW